MVYSGRAYLSPLSSKSRVNTENNRADTCMPIDCTGVLEIVESSSINPVYTSLNETSQRYYFWAGMLFSRPAFWKKCCFVVLKKGFHINDKIVQL